MDKPFYKWTSQELIDYLKRIDRPTRLRLLFYFGGGLLFLVFILWPAWVLRPAVHAEVQQLKNQIRLGEARIGQEGQIRKEKEEKEAIVRGVRSKLLTEEEAERLVGILAGIAETSGVTLLSTEPEEEGAREGLPPYFEGKYRRFSYVVTIEGGYHPIAMFVSEMENHPKIFRISELSIMPKEETPKIHLGQIIITAFATVESAKG